MVENLAKAFMIIPVKSLRFIFRISMLALFAGCSPDLSDDQIPHVPFPDYTVNLSFHPALTRDGGYLQLSSKEGGVQGIIVYRVNANTYHAYERNCSYQPNGACVTVSVDPSGFFMTEPCCNSTFNLTDGSPTGGPAWRPLNRYNTHVSSNVLTITDVVVN